MSSIKLLFVSDIHYSANLAGEMALAGTLLPSDTYDHFENGRLIWHNYMLVDKMDRTFDGLDRLIRHESPDLVVFTGDMVNTNWAPNVAAVAARITALPCPTRLITGNHDIYLHGPGTRLQDSIKPGEYATGFRHEWIDELGLLYLDLFVHHSDGVVAKTTEPNDAQAAAVYRAEDINAALHVLDSAPGRRFIAIGHFPMQPPDERLRGPGRKIGWKWPTGEALGERVQQSGNLIGIVCGHQHFAHLQQYDTGFHWTLPSLVEYPCEVGILTMNGSTVSGRLVSVDPDLASESLAVRSIEWPAGETVDRSFSITLPH
jgi:predicted phosphodiesterase